MSTRSKSDMAKRREALMQDNGPGLDRFALAATITATQPSGTSPRSHQVQAPEARDASGQEEGGTTIAPIGQVVENPLNARQSYQEKRINNLAASIAQRGQLTPALACLLSDVQPLVDDQPIADALRRLVAESQDPRYLLLGGHYRKKALTKLERPTIELKVVPVRALLDLYALSYIENDEREDTTPLDDAIAWQNLLTLGVAKTQEDISRVTNKPRTTIVKTLAILKLPQEVVDLFRESETDYSYLAAYTLTQLMSHVTRDKLLGYAHQIVEGTITTRDLEAALAAVTAEAPTPRKPKSYSRQHKLHMGGKELGVLKEWDSGRVVLDVKLDDQMTREQLVSEMRRRFGGEGDPQLTLK